ncbi:MAG: hypothetical protein JWN67_436 [Actinomycetia bacterium]|nr:hypothetical protein [Actinomycetes bacterium]
MQLIVKGRLQGTGFDRMLLPDTNADGNCMLDLAEARFIEPYPLVAMACFVDATVKLQTKLGFIPPQDAQVSNYLSRMGFVEMLTKRYKFTKQLLPPVRATPHPNDLIELQWFDGSDVTQIADFVWEQLRRTASSGALNALHSSLWEIAENVLFHAGTGGGWIAAQTYKRGTSSARVDVAIGDVGHGIQKTMHRHNPQTDLEAIDLALRYGVSGLDDPARGIGLADTAEQVRGLGGVVMVRSGNARRRLTRQESKGAQVTFLPGTIVGLSVPCG